MVVVVLGAADADAKVSLDAQSVPYLCEFAKLLIYRVHRIIQPYKVSIVTLSAKHWIMYGSVQRCALGKQNMDLGNEHPSTEQCPTMVIVRTTFVEQKRVLLSGLHTIICPCVFVAWDEAFIAVKDKEYCGPKPGPTIGVETL